MLTHATADGLWEIKPPAFGTLVVSGWSAGRL